VPQSGPVEGCHTFSGHSPFEQVCRRFLDAGSVAFCPINRPSRSALAAPQTAVMLPLCAGESNLVTWIFGACATHPPPCAGPLPFLPSEGPAVMSGVTTAASACLFSACYQAQGFHTINREVKNCLHSSRPQCYRPTWKPVVTFHLFRFRKKHLLREHGHRPPKLIAFTRLFCGPVRFARFAPVALSHKQIAAKLARIDCI